MYARIRVDEPAASAPAVLLVLVDHERRLLAVDEPWRSDAERLIPAALARRPEFSGDAGSMTVVDDPQTSRRWLVCSVGKREKFDVRAALALGGRALDRLNDMKAAAVHLAHTAPALAAATATQGSAGAPEWSVARALGEGLELGRFRFETFKSKKNGNGSGDTNTAAASGTAVSDTAASPQEKGPEELVVTLPSGDPALRAELERGLMLGTCANISRGFSSLPPNVAHPTFIADEAEKLAAAHGLSCEVIVGDRLEALDLVGLSTVGRASSTPPCLIVLKYTPAANQGDRGADDPSGAPVVLIGKTLTYDTGGLSLKPGPSMRGMKADKNGGMAVLGAMQAIASARPAVPVVALLPTAENSVAGNAFRPDDIIRYPNGVTVEVTNTDAEGRLVLADALVYACRTLKPRAILDIATLTGGVVTALGNACAGLWCADADLKSRVMRAAERTGERVWELPLWEDYRELMKAKVADIWNSAPERSAHPIQGAAFLSFFVEENIPWAHIDIAGVSVTDRDRPPFVTGPTGFGARLLAEVVTEWA